MKAKETKLEGCFVIEPNVFNDDRGYFFESFKQNELNEFLGYDVKFCQDNESKSTYGVLRGLHFQKPPFEQAKLVRCIKGKVLDVAVDLRIDSKTYGKHVTVELSEENKRQLYVPRGFAHGFVVLSKEAIFAYKVDNTYAPIYDSGIAWDDKDLAIEWEIAANEVKLSEKDQKLMSFSELDSPF